MKALLLTVPLYSAPRAVADVTLPSLFSQGAVLQRDQPIPIWGAADPGEQVTVSFAGKETSVTANEHGEWKLELPAQAAGGPFGMKVVGKNALHILDIYVGEVWIASGQSNMDFRLLVRGAAESPYVKESQAMILAANDPKLRVFTVDKVVSTEPVKSTVPYKKAAWVATTPESAGSFTAVGYHFGRVLREKLKVPVGIIHTSWGGTAAESWTSLAALGQEPLKYILKQRSESLEKYPAALKNYEEVVLKKWEADAEAAKAAGTTPPRKPGGPVGVTSPHLPGNLFNAMINPLIPYRIAGVIWYQGESNSGRPKEYHTLFSSMINDWRTHWGQGDFPFLFVQLANYQKQQVAPVEGSGWVELREAQEKTLSVPNTGMASAVDLADPENPSDIHPHNKKDVGERLALNALAKVYHQKVESFSGPIFTGMKVDGAKVRLSFQHADGGLKAKGEKLTGFAIAGKDGKFVWADAAIDGDTVVVNNAAVAEPTAVRYSWAINPIGNLYNGAGLPTSPFRTDKDRP